MLPEQTKGSQYGDAQRHPTDERAAAVQYGARNRGPCLMGEHSCYHRYQQRGHERQEREKYLRGKCQPHQSIPS